MDLDQIQEDIFQVTGTRLHQEMPENGVGLKDQGIIVVDCDAILALDRSIKVEYAKDTLHLNSAGYEALNDSLNPIFRKLVQNGSKSDN